ncbi:CDP-glycerol glycerophosphotransferase family protein [Bacillus sp. EAC]|uniref:CDP-glycerol glycerophosphotransferase family protein n=1 Tax=Bacillus sp. EAC TaxID=1978338 RepID=UPI000B442BCA|nr:CDP-glycerol glycerophosphotransferase family protein [Bacillus sp. EAC]
MKKKVIIHSMYLKNMDSFIDYYKKNGLDKWIKLIKIESGKSKISTDYIKKIYYTLFRNYDAIVSDYPTTLLENKKATSIAMGHGTAIKRFPSTAELKHKKNLKLSKTVKSADYFVTTSDRQNNLEYRNPILDQYSNNEYISLGLPKNDYYFDEKNVINTNKKIREKLGFLDNQFIVVYAPTWRDFKSGNERITKNDLIKINKLLKELNGYLIYRPHPLGGTFDGDILEELKLENIIPSSSIDIDLFETLCISNALISDYSSIAIEYLPLKKPVLFFLFDQEEYEVERGIEFDYLDSSISPGVVVKTVDELINELNNVIENKYQDSYWVNRRKICLENHYKYPDGKSAERIWKLILKELT